MKKEIEINENLYIGTTDIKLKDLANDLYYKPGDILSLSGITMSGFVTAGTTNFRTNIVVDKSLKNINSVNCLSFNAEMRSQKGYLNSTSGFNNYANDSLYSITCEIRSEHIILINISKETGWGNIDNNTLAVAYLAPLTLKFN